MKLSNSYEKKIAFHADYLTYDTSLKKNETICKNQSFIILVLKQFSCNKLAELITVTFLKIHSTLTDSGFEPSFPYKKARTFTT